jgi:glucose-1-phosphate thymidylyltransferase
MKGVVLAGGKGTRLLPLTKVVNKHLLPVYDRPMIYYPISTLVKAGVTSILIVTGKENAGAFLDLLGSGKDFGARFQFALQEEAGGIAQALSLAQDFADGDDVVAVLGDNIIFDDVRPYVSTFSGGAMAFFKKVKDPRRFGVPVFDGSRLVAIEEKPSQPKSEYAQVGLYVYDSTVYDKIRSIRPSARGELEITDVNNLYLKEGRLSYAFLNDLWLDVGTFDSLLEAANYVRAHLKERVEPWAKLEEKRAGRPTALSACLCSSEKTK